MVDPAKEGYIGNSWNRIDAFGKVTGEAQFPGDINLPNQSYMKVLFANRPHAIIRKIDTSTAEAMPGVLAVFTAADVPVNEYGLIMNDQPVLCGPGSSKPYAERVRFVGDQVAVIVAETEAIAALARDLIVVDYEDLPIVTNPLEAMQAESCLVHPDRSTNVFCHYRIRNGDVDSAFCQADVIVENTYHTPFQEHAYLQPEAGLATIDEEGRVKVIVAGQWTHEDQKQIAHALDLPQDQVRVVYPAIGGAFGGREDMSVQIILALAAWRLHQRGINRPVKIIWSREESIIGHHKRHPYTIRAKWGATCSGKIIAADVEVIADGGAYAYTSTKVLGNATLMCTGPYEIPNVRVDSFAVYTNNIPGGAFRGFGGPQGAFAAEGQINALAEVLGMDPVDIRLRNVLREGALLPVGTPLPPGVSMAQVIASCASAAGWEVTEQEALNAVSADYPGGSAVEDQVMVSPLAKYHPHASILKRPAVTTPPPPHLKRGIGFACAYKNVGFSFGFPEQCWATVELHGGVEIDFAVVYHAGADVGQGAHTVFAQMAATALGIGIDKVKLVLSDTAFTDNSGSTSASRMTFMAGKSIQGACEQALEKWCNEERPAVARFQYRPPPTTPYDPQTGKSDPNFAYGYVAQAVTVEVDTELGSIRLLDVICADDVGRAINPRLVQGQIEGAVVQAGGYAILENFVHQGGYVQTKHLSTYLIPSIVDIPENVHSLILEYPDPIGPWGARGMAEMPFLPLAPAVISAVHDATGVWFYEFPLTPERVLRGLGRI
jgi:CO/xanthine dehydrogenase Mo-binding subunit